MATDSSALAGAAPGSTPVHRLLPVIVPALAVGVASALVLPGVSLLAEKVQDVLRGALPDALSVGRHSALRMIVMLTASGPAAGLLVTGRPQMQLPEDGTPLR
ncbi:hypothetical protein ACFVT1_06900 [Streptomyces sp. NPDC057963]|uniref:hypothetical protein n=1 Tax=Streptomyces sp. NPDC057963 TaxID=3346290 RepID=UPI0036EAC634